jgi:O-succinylbenzoic acid--CoA ligase
MDRLGLTKLLDGSLSQMETRPPGRVPDGDEGVAAPTPIVINEAEPVGFMSAFATAAAGRGPVFLADPAWEARERTLLNELCRKSATLQSPAGHGWLCVPSGGTSGALKFARHDEQTIQAAVRGFCAHFGVQCVNAIGLLPLYHVSGLMAWMRCALTGGRYEPWSWKELEAGRRPEVTGDNWFLSLVPTQLQRLLDSVEAVTWLKKFRVIFIGGGPAWPELIVAARRLQLPVSLSYGMTETAAMVAAQRPAEFLLGAAGCGKPLPHAVITLATDGTVSIAGESVFRGYWPEWREEREFVTADLGRFDEHGSLHILGRSDATIITGGKKVAPTDVEAALHATAEFTDVAVIGLPDTEWGQLVVACYPSTGRQPDLQKVEATLQRSLSSHLRPKRYVGVAVWPRNAQGKLNRAALLAALTEN